MFVCFGEDMKTRTFLNCKDFSWSLMTTALVWGEGIYMFDMMIKEKVKHGFTRLNELLKEQNRTTCEFLCNRTDIIENGVKTGLVSKCHGWENTPDSCSAIVAKFRASVIASSAFVPQMLNRKTKYRHFSKPVVGGGRGRLFLITAITIVKPFQMYTSTRQTQTSVCRVGVIPHPPPSVHCVNIQRDSAWRFNTDVRNTDTPALCAQASFFQSRVSFCPLLCRYTWTRQKKQKQQHRNWFSGVHS